MNMHPASGAAVADHTCRNGLPAARKLAALILITYIPAISLMLP